VTCYECMSCHFRSERLTIHGKCERCNGNSLALVNVDIVREFNREKPSILYVSVTQNREAEGVK